MKIEIKIDIYNGHEFFGTPKKKPVAYRDVKLKIEDTFMNESYYIRKRDCWSGNKIMEGNWFRLDRGIISSFQYNLDKGDVTKFKLYKKDIDKFKIETL